MISLRKAAHWSDEAYRKRLRQEVRKYLAFATGLHTYMTSGEINPQLRWINGRPNSVARRRATDESADTRCASIDICQSPQR